MRNCRFKSDFELFVTLMRRCREMDRLSYSYVNYTIVAQDRLRDHKCAMSAEITVLSTTMVLSSWQCHCESSSQIIWWIQTAPSGRRPSAQANRAGLWVRLSQVTVVSITTIT